MLYYITKILTLPELIKSTDHDLWFLLEREDFAQDMLSCAAGPFAEFKRVPPRLRTRGTGTKRHEETMRLLADVFERNYFGQIYARQSQLRISAPGMNEVQLHFLLRNARPTQTGFSTDKMGKMIEEASLLHFDTFEFVDGHPSKRGILLAYDELPDSTNHVDMWIAYEWTANQGSKIIRCSSAAHLGKMRFGTDDTTGNAFNGTPVRGSTGSQLELD